MKKPKAQERIKKYFLKPVVNDPPNDAAANTNQIEKTTPIHSQSNEHTSNETTTATPTVYQPKQIIRLAHSIFQKGTIEVKFVFAVHSGFQNIIG